MLIAVILIMTTMVAIRMPSVDFYKSHNFASVLAADLRLTKALSMSQNQRYRLVIGAGSYQIQDQNSTAILNPETNAVGVTYPTGVTITPNTTIIFDSLGRPYNAAGTALTSTLNLTVTSAGVTQVLSITPQTGFIQ